MEIRHLSASSARCWQSSVCLVLTPRSVEGYSWKQARGLSLCLGSTSRSTPPCIFLPCQRGDARCAGPRDYDGLDESLECVDSISLLLDEEYFLPLAVLASELADVTKPPRCRRRYGGKQIRIYQLKSSNGVVCSRLGVPFLFDFPKRTFVTG